MATTHKEILLRTVDALEKSLRRYPENGKILQQLAVAYSQLGRFDGMALGVYRRALEFAGEDEKLRRALSIAEMVAGSSQIARELSSLDHVDQDSLWHGIERLHRLAEEFPDSPILHRALADYQLLAGEEREAIQHYRCAVALGITDLESVCTHFENIRRLRDLSGMVSVFIAGIYQRLGNLDKAEALFEDLASQRNPERIVLDKYAEFLQRRIEETEAHDESAMSNHLRQLTRVCLLRGNASEALTWARQLTSEQLARDTRLAKDLARRLMAIEDFRQAFEYLSQVPMDAETKGILNEMAVLLEKRGELDTAVYILQYINDNDDIAQSSRRSAEGYDTATPSDISIEIETSLQMAELHWKNRRWEMALECYLHVLELGYEEYRTLSEPLDLLIDRMPEVRTDQLVLLADFYAGKREWKRCLRFAMLALQAQPELDDMSQRVLQACDRILIEHPEDWDVRLVNGDEHLRLGHIERAIQEYRRCMGNPEYSMKINRRLALAHFRAGDHQNALSRYSELPVLEAEDLEHLYDLAVAFAGAEQFKEAFQTAKLIVEYDAEFRDVKDKLEEYEEKANRGSAGFIIDPKMRELIGDHSIGRYKYVEKIGSGGMGVVHKVVDLKTNQEVAMKILREGLSSSGKAIDRFFREARIAATLHHRNIVNILDYNISNNFGQSYIAMEYVDGPSLRDIIEKKFASTVDIAIDDILEGLGWASQLCDALHATHQKGIIHRDIKPDNIMIAKDGIVKITDFGIVHIEEATFTPTGALIGTPRYMSPEQVHGGRIDARSDIYSVGIILYEFFIGFPPFISGDISYQQVNVLPTPPREICPAVPPEVDRLILKCLEKAPSDRYQNAMELKTAVDETYIRLGGDPSLLRGQTSAGEERAAPPAPAASGRVNPLTPLWLVPVPAQTPPSSAASQDSAALGETAESPAASEPAPRGRVTVDYESDFDFDSPRDAQERIDTDFDTESHRRFQGKIDTDFDP